MVRKLRLLLALTVPALPQAVRYQHLYTFGAEGINPPQIFTGRAGKLLFGKPERTSPLNVPDSVTVDPEERVWITDRAAVCVHIFDLLRNDYRVLRAAGRTAFRCPAGIDSDMHGRVYVADACLGQIFIFEKDGTFLRSLLGRSSGRPVIQPGAVAVSRDLKRIYVADPVQHKVVVLNQEGEAVGELGGLKEPDAISLDRHKAFVLDTALSTVEAFASDGSHAHSLTWPEVRKPSAFGFDPEQKLYFVGDPRFAMILAYDEQRKLLGAFGQAGSGAGRIHAPAKIYVDAMHRVYSVDAQSGKVAVFGQVSRQAAGR